MSFKIQIRRGSLEDMPQLDNGELGYAEDVEELYVGTPTGNKLVGLSAIVTRLEGIENRLSVLESV